ncbi:MAG TPA: 1,4-dihydroxy-2-naphthoate polyprenyltransferase [Chloroflexota bacterium]|nr:1,4-dihydroxy-2-naphthoate polyprenyltransferase [Chloroflexota bacterium]
MAGYTATTRPNYLSAWLEAARPATLPAAVVPVIVGTAAASGHGALRPWSFVAAFVCALLIQIGTNFANDLFDFQKGADTADRIGPRRISQSGLVAIGQVAAATYITFGLAAVFGLYLVAVSGWPILLAGVLSILSGVAYTGGPWPLGYHGLGDVFVFVFFGVVAVVGSAFVQTNTISLLAVVAAIPVGFLVTAILVVNNLRDVDTDRRAGKRTLAVRIGRTATRRQYAALLMASYLIPLALWWAGWLGGTFWLPWLSLPLAASLIQTVGRDSDGPSLNRALKRTGQLHLLFGVLFAASFIW